MIIEGLFLGAVTFASLATLFGKMPQVVKNFFMKHTLLTDISSTTFAYITLGAISSSAVAALAAGIVGILFELYMHYVKARTT